MFLSASVIQFIPSALIEINQSVAFQNIQAQVATELPSNNVVHDDVGISGIFLNGRIFPPISLS